MIQRTLLGLLLVSLAGCPSDAPPPSSQFLDAGGQNPTGNTPPELVRIGDRIVAVGENLIIELEASDVDGDLLSFSSFGKLPLGSKFNKGEHRFEWTPTLSGQTVYLTFVVSDGQSFDRETIRIEVVKEKANHGPTFQVIGDQQAIVGEPFGLQLVATDADGDAIKFSVDGELPEQSNLDPATGIFVWTPKANLAGQTIRLSFVVSDGMLSDAMDVNVIVFKDGSTAGPAPPTFPPIDPQVAQLETTFTLKLLASDPNGDPLTFSIYTGAPPDSTLSDDVFSYTPKDSEEGFTFVTTFSVSDGVFTAYQTVDISVKKSAGPISCYDDAGEPNPSLFEATPVTAGTHSFSICDTETTPKDSDYFRIFVPSGQTLTVSMSHDPEAGDLDLLIVDGAHLTVGASQTGATTETATAKSKSNQELFIYVFGVGQADYHVSYTLNVGMATTVDCVDDIYEPNDVYFSAKALPPPGASLQICAGSPDWWEVYLSCGEDATFTLDTGNAGDLDMHLYGSTGNDEPVIAAAATGAVIEVLDFKDAPEAGLYHLRVSGFPTDVTEAPYTLMTTLGGACVDDNKSGSSKWDASPLVGGEGELFGLRLCCKNDWFQINLAAGQSLLATVVPFTGGHSAGITLFDEYMSPLDSAPPSLGGDTVDTVASKSSPFFLKIEGSVDTEYKLEWVIVNESAAGCTTLSCSKYDVCDAATGECVSDFCFDDAACPSGYVCKETYCANPCTAGIDCRNDYACKAFEDGQFCGITGNSPYGQDCNDHTDCISNGVCSFPMNLGYCAPLGCVENGVACPTGTQCTIPQAGVSICGLKCYSNNDCRVDDGYACVSYEFDPVGICLP